MASSIRAPDPALSMHDSIYDSFRWLDDDDDLDLSLDNYEYHNHVGRDCSATNKPSHQRKPSFRRTFSFTSFQRNGPSAAGNNRARPVTQTFNNNNHVPTPSRTSSRAPSVIRRHERSFSRSLSSPQIPKHTPQLSVTSIDQPAQYYQDPDARLKLRVYLASPQNFDEAIEFGFPSLEDSNNNNNDNDEEDPAHRRPSTARRSQSPEKTTTFLENASVSYLDDMTPTTDSPLTPDAFPPAKAQESEHELQPQPQPQPQQPQPQQPQTQPSTRNSMNRQPQSPMKPQRVSQNLAGGREMTLKMTLTRADLRTSGSVGTAEGRDADDPLKLADLPVSDENNPIWDTPDQQSVVKKMWQRLKRRI